MVERPLTRASIPAPIPVYAPTDVAKPAKRKPAQLPPGKSPGQSEMPAETMPMTTPTIMPVSVPFFSESRFWILATLAISKRCSVPLTMSASESGLMLSSLPVVSVPDRSVR